MRKSAPVFVRHGPTRKAPREYAHCMFKQGFGLLAHGLNVCGNVNLPYRYSKATHDKFMSLATQIYALVDGGEIIELPHVMARTDPRFQRFMEATIAPKARRGRKSPA